MERCIIFLDGGGGIYYSLQTDGNTGVIQDCSFKHFSCLFYPLVNCLLSWLSSSLWAFHVASASPSEYSLLAATSG